MASDRKTCKLTTCTSAGRRRKAWSEVCNDKCVDQERHIWGGVNSLFRLGVRNARDMECLCFLVFRFVIGDHRWDGSFARVEVGLHPRIDQRTV